MRFFWIAICLLAGTARADPAIWHVASKDAGEMWLLGSVHYLREQDYPLPAVIDALYERADVLVMELDLDDLDPLSAQSQFMRSAMLPAPKTLRDVVPTDLYVATQAAATKLGLDLSAFAQFEPWLVALTLMDLGMADLGYRSDRGIEQYLLNRSTRDGKQVHGLEMLSDQIAVFDRLDLSQQQALLAQTLDDMRSSEQDMDALLAAWRAGRLTELAAELSASFERFPELYEALVVERNRRWLAELEQHLARRGRALVIVGALHLVGANNVVDLLRERGFAVEPYSAP